LNNPITICSYKPVLEQVKLLLIIAILSASLQAQRVPQFTQYMYNTISINPAYVEDKGGMTVMALHRNQWLGIESSPKSYMLTLNSELKKDKMNGGISILHDNFGAGKDTYVNLDYSYRIYLSRSNTISFGLKAGILNRDNDFSNLTIYQQNDPSFQNDFASVIKPSFGLGVYYNSYDFYVGLSALNALENYQINTNSPIKSDSQITSYLIAGYVFERSENFKLKPATLIKYVAGSPLQIDLSLNSLINDQIVAGLAYRYNSALSGIVGFHLNEKILMGLSYDRDVYDLGKIKGNIGSFELFLKFNIFASEERFLPPRFF